MIREIRMPNLGTTVDEMKIVNWLKKEGERIERGEPVFEVETDKATMEVESYLSGYLKKIAAGPGEAVTTGSIVAYIGEQSDEFPEGSAVITAEGAEPEADTAVGKQAAFEIRISPMVKKMAEKQGVDITKIKGSGPDGLILKEDVMRAAAPGMDEAEKEETTAAKTVSQPEIVPFSRIGLATAKAMRLSKLTIPHVYFTIEVNASAMKELRALSGKKHSYNAMIAYNVAKCLKAFPFLAAVYDDKGRIMPHDINIGIAVAKGDELFVPVIKGITENGNELARIEQEIQRLIKKVETGELKQEDMTGGVFTVTNLGSYGISSFTAVINPPEAAILAVGAMEDRVVAEDGGVFIRPMLTMTLSVDHRIVNGTYAAKFLNTLKQNLERM